MSKRTTVTSAQYPSTISGILQFNYGDAATASPGSAISTWEATTGNNLTGGTGSTRPTVETNLVSGKAIKVIRFDGTDDFLTNKFTATATQPFTMFATYRLRSLGIAQRMWDSAFGETPRNLHMVNGADQLQYYNGTFQVIADAQTNWNITVIIVDGARTRMSTNGSSWQVVGASTGTDSPTGITVAASNNGSTDPAQMDLENIGAIGNTNFHIWGAGLTNWMHGRIY